MAGGMMGGGMMGGPGMAGGMMGGGMMGNGNMDGAMMGGGMMGGGMMGNGNMDGAMMGGGIDYGDAGMYGGGAGAGYDAEVRGADYDAGDGGSGGGGAGGGGAGGGGAGALTASYNSQTITGGSGPQTMANGGFNNVVFNYTSNMGTMLQGEMAGDIINSGQYTFGGSSTTGNGIGLGAADVLKINTTASMQYNGQLLSSLGSDINISSSGTFAGGGGLEFGLLNIGSNIVAAFDIDGDGNFTGADSALDVSDDITSARYIASTDTFEFFV